MFWSKSDSRTKKKAPARKPTNSRPEWGCTPQMDSTHVLMKTHQNPIQVLVNKSLFPKVQKTNQRIGQIEAMT